MKVPDGRLYAGGCGPASLRIAAENLGVPVSEQELHNKLVVENYFYDPEWGTDGDTMLEGVAMLGLRGTWLQNMSLDTLQTTSHWYDFSLFMFAILPLTP